MFIDQVFLLGKEDRESFNSATKWLPAGCGSVQSKDHGSSKIKISSSKEAKGVHKISLYLSKTEACLDVGHGQENKKVG